MIRSHEYPVIGTWYWDIEHEEQFEIVAQDATTKNIEIQFYTGNIEEIDLDTWFDMRVVSIAAPKDWSGPFDMDQSEFSEYTNDTNDPLHNPSSESSFDENS